MIRIIRDLYVRSWNINGYWINLRDEILHISVLFSLTYPFALYVKSVWIFLALIGGCLFKEAVDVLRKVGEWEMDDIFNDLLTDMIANILGIGTGFIIAEAVKEMQLSLFESLCTVLLALFITYMVWDLDQYHFSPDKGFGLYRDHLYVFAESGEAGYTGKHPEPDTLIHEWDQARMDRFWEEYSRRMIQKAMNKGRSRFGDVIG